ncbi:MAG: dTDP-4-dehydrorhamnose 3,5-epimerase [Gemmatimonadaceae bacterium]
MKLTETPLSGLWEIQTSPRGDERGRFTRLFCAEEFAPVRPNMRFVQVNHSMTAKRGTVRGLHYQHAPAAEAKLIRCIRGTVFDVAVDVRESSPTFGKWHAVELSQDNERQVFIPEGFAHGFQALTDNVELLYQHTVPFAPTCERGVLYRDPFIGIEWPLFVTILSERDANLPLLNSTVAGCAA